MISGFRPLPPDAVRGDTVCATRADVVAFTVGLCLMWGLRSRGTRASLTSGFSTCEVGKTVMCRAVSAKVKKEKGFI